MSHGHLKLTWTRLLRAQTEGNLSWHNMPLYMMNTDSKALYKTTYSKCAIWHKYYIFLPSTSHFVPVHVLIQTFFCLITPTIFISSHSNHSAERPWTNGHCNNRAIVCVVGVEGTNGDARGVSAQLKPSSSFHFSNIHSVFTNISIRVSWWFPH